jgi:hypothetical protein
MISQATGRPEGRPYGKEKLPGFIEILHSEFVCVWNFRMNQA